jgi:hypothetical protein
MTLRMWTKDFSRCIALVADCTANSLETRLKEFFRVSYYLIPQSIFGKVFQNIHCSAACASCRANYHVKCV